MATAATEAKNADSYLTPGTSPNSSSYGELYLNADAATLISVDGVELLVPEGFNKLLLQPRKCGDFYAELDGPISVASFAKTRPDAIRAAIKRAELVSA